MLCTLCYDAMSMGAFDWLRDGKAGRRTFALHRTLTNIMISENL